LLVAGAGAAVMHDSRLSWVAEAVARMLHAIETETESESQCQCNLNSIVADLIVCNCSRARWSGRQSHGPCRTIVGGGESNRGSSTEHPVCTVVNVRYDHRLIIISCQYVVLRQLADPCFDAG
jgi:hypothetical protein